MRNHEDGRGCASVILFFTVVGLVFLGVAVCEIFT